MQAMKAVELCSEDIYVICVLNIDYYIFPYC